MKLSFIITIFFTFQTFFLSAQELDGRYELSKDKSAVKWVSKDRDKEYVGSMKLKEGYLVMKGDKLSELVVFVDVQSIDIRKFPEGEDTYGLLQFIKSPTFLNATAMDYAVFKMYAVEELKNSNEGNYLVTGNLTIKGYSNEISFPAMVEIKKDKVTATTKFTMNRKLWKLENPMKEDGSAYTMEQTLTLFVTLEGSKSKSK